MGPTQLFLFLILISLDLGSKAIIKEQFIRNNNSELLFSSNLLDIKNLCNHGISFSILESIPTLYLNIIIGIVVCVMIFYLRSLSGNTNLGKYSYTMIITGAVANFIDRIIHGCVYDFIDLHFYNYHWYVFNLADSYISVGAILLLIAIHMPVNHRINL